MRNVSQSPALPGPPDRVTALLGRMTGYFSNFHVGAAPSHRATLGEFLQQAGIGPVFQIRALRLREVGCLPQDCTGRSKA